MVGRLALISIEIEIDVTGEEGRFMVKRSFHQYEYLHESLLNNVLARLAQV